MAPTTSKKRKLVPTPAIAANCPNEMKPKADLHSFGAAIELIVGPKSEVFVFHKNQLCSIAPYFEAALNGGFKEASEQKIIMPEESPGIIRRFQLWTYTGSVVGHTETGRLLDWSELVQLYIFAERRGIALLQDHLIDTLAAECYYSITFISAYVEYIYCSTEEGSPLRKFFVHLAAINLSSGNIDKKDAFYENCPKEFFMDLAFELVKTDASHLKTRSPTEDVCTFHIHPLSV